MWQEFYYTIACGSKDGKSGYSDLWQKQIQVWLKGGY